MTGPNLMRSIEELEKDLDERMRNLYPMDPEIPRSNFPQEVRRILSMKTLPEEYAESSVWKHAHWIFWQIEAYKGNPEATMWHPA